jgi:predicted AlkP superfamily pyrophosphatase or phosphodiesterase
MTGAGAQPDAIQPDYGGAWIGGIVPALLSGERPDWLPAPAREAERVALLVLDGLGWDLLSQHRGDLPALAAMEGGPITAAVPSTTAAGLTSITTGTAPAEHGLAGYRVRVGGTWLNVLRWDDNGPDPRTVQSIAPFLGRPVPVVTRAEFRRTGFTVAHLRGADLIGWRMPSALVEHVDRLTTDGRHFVYAYYDGVDKVAHEFGLRSGFVASEMRATDQMVGELLGRLPDDWALVITADHGQVHVDRDGIVTLDEVAGLVGNYGGEGRFRSLSARPGARASCSTPARRRMAAVRGCSPVSDCSTRDGSARPRL